MQTLSDNVNTASALVANANEYTPVRKSMHCFLPIRNWVYHCHIWGQSNRGNKPPLLLLHGWMDVGASFQLVVDAMRQERYCIALDWRGFGHTRHAAAVYEDNHMHAEYLADLDMLLDHLVGDQVVDLVGHSMGGNIAMLYAGIRPERVQHVVNLEGFGLPQTQTDLTPKRYRQWLDEVKQCRNGAMDLKSYPSREAVAGRLMKNNPRLAPAHAQWLAQHWAEPTVAGTWRILGDAAHKVISPTLYRVDEVLAVHAQITAPVLSVVAMQSNMQDYWRGRYTLDEYHQRLQAVPHVQHATVNDAGHMLHHDQPQRVAQLIEDFVDGMPVHHEH